MNNNFTKIAIIILTVATALIHIGLAIPNGTDLIMFYLNGIGYLVLVAALYMPQFSQYRNLARWALIGFAAVTILAWVFVGARSPIGYIDKLIEITLIVLLFVEGRQSSG